MRNIFDGWHIVVLVLVIVVLFGWKRLPDAARSMGRSMRIFKAEVGEMKNDTRPSGASSPASADTVRGDVVPPVQDPFHPQPTPGVPTDQPTTQPQAPTQPEHQPRA